MGDTHVIRLYWCPTLAVRILTPEVCQDAAEEGAATRHAPISQEFRV